MDSDLVLVPLITGSRGVGIFYMAKLKTHGQNALKANYESLSYCHSMQQQLKISKLSSKGSLQKFETALLKQERNVTEPGEDSSTAGLRQKFNQLKSGDTSKFTLQSIESSIQSILAVNMQAIINKIEISEQIADDALAIIIGPGGVVFLIAFTFIVNFPSVVTDPIYRLSDAIKEIANKNYQHRINISNKDEFGKLADAFNEMAERLQYFESSNLNKLMFKKTRAEAVINSLKDASIGIDKNNTVLFANFQALELLGLRSDEIVGKQVGDTKKKNDLFSFLIDKGTTTPFKILVDNKENYFVKEIINVSPDDADNKVIVLKTITSYKEPDVAKTNFISTISHELKTPLASSDFSLQLLEDERTGKLLPEQAELVDNLKQDNQRMLKILSELLNMAQVEAGRIQLNIQGVQPGGIVETAVQAVLGNAREKEIEIRKSIALDLPLIQADSDKTTWVLNNFLTNAIKYSYRNNAIEVQAYRQGDSVVFAVKDGGPGIAAEYLPRLFERYFQVPGSKEKGTGLGLAISKEFVEAQHGKIWVESEVGNGARFCFELPIQTQLSPSF